MKTLHEQKSHVCVITHVQLMLLKSQTEPQLVAS